MTLPVTSRRADVGLPDVANDWAFLDDLLGDARGQGTYFDDGFTWEDHAGSVLAGTEPLVRGSGRIFEPGRGQGYERAGGHRTRVGVIGGSRLGGAAVRHAFGD